MRSDQVIRNSYSILAVLLVCCVANCLILHETTVPTGIKPQRLDVFISENFQYSRSSIGGLCEKGIVIVNEKAQSKSYKVQKGDMITFSVEEKEASKVTPENIPLDIIFEDSNLIIVNKPSGMVVHPAVGSPNGTFVNALLYHLGSDADKLVDSDESPILESIIPDIDNDMDSDEDGDLVLDLPETPEAAVASHVSLRPGIVHRLDKGTTGVLMAAKSTEAVMKLSKLFADREVRKVYVAICVGHPGEATIVEPIGRSMKNRQMMCTYDGPPGKLAISHVRTLAFDGKLSVCLVRIETGRTHQIRVHLQERRTPIIGDDTYGNANWNKKLLQSDQIRRPLLHAYETEFINPYTGEQQVIQAPLPADMASLIEKITQSAFATQMTATLDDREDSTYGYDDQGLANGRYKDVFDKETRLLTGSTEVQGRRLVVGAENARKRSLFVPLDRVVLDDGGDDLADLPEELDDWVPARSRP